MRGSVATIFGESRWHATQWDQGVATEKVSHASSVPARWPVWNHRARCADEPCENVSGRTRPVAIFCKASSPIACAAPSASSMSPASSSSRWLVECAQMPA